MGWITRRSKESSLSSNILSLSIRERKETEAIFITTLKDKSSTEHIEKISTNDKVSLRYPFANIDTNNQDLPFIPANEITAKQNNPDERLWIVIDSIVYDCTDFVFSHPGGTVVIQSFRGQDCSWQFWRFHDRSHMDTFGRPLRTGRTEKVQNRFQERPRWVGLKKLWNAVDDD